ncbi:MAG: YdcF family protein, partial [Atopobiaceae bacterium]|nr:YdcF family protein [Atopobiaceae bacterium]
TPSIAGLWAFPAGSASWWACAVTGTLALLVCVTFFQWFNRMVKACGTQESVDEDAAIVVLGGLIVGGRPVPTIVNRLGIAADLWRESPKRVIVVSGGATPDGATTEAQAMAQWLQEKEGIPSSAILLEDAAINTDQNMELSIKLLKEPGLSVRQVCVVSSDYHLYRAITLGRRYAQDVVGVGALVPPTSMLQQWCREVLTILAKRVW